MLAAVLQPHVSADIVNRVLFILFYAMMSTCVYVCVRQLIHWISVGTLLLFEDGEAFWLHVTIAVLSMAIEYFTPAQVVSTLMEQGPQYVFGNIVMCSSVLFLGVKLFGLADRELRRLSIISFLLLSLSGITAYYVLYTLDKLFFS